MNEMVYTTPADIRKIIAEIVEAKKKLGGIKRAYCVACGGSLSCFYPMTYFLKSEAKELACDSVTANEFVHATPKALGEDCIVFAMSLAAARPRRWRRPGSPRKRAPASWCSAPSTMSRWSSTGTIR